MTTVPFRKMNGLGNDFVVLDTRRTALDLTPARRRAIADRRLGVGCDQLIVLEPPTIAAPMSSCGFTTPTAARLAPAAMPRAAWRRC